MTSTLKLFEPNIKLHTHFKCFSKEEKNMKEMGLGKFEERKEYVSTFSPQKRPRDYRQTTDYQSEVKQKYRPYVNYNTNIWNIFSFRLDSCMNNILFYCVGIMNSGFIKDKVRGDKINYYTYSEKNAKNTQFITTFDSQCKDILNSLFYSVHCLDFMNRNEEIWCEMRSLSEAYFSNVRSSVLFGNLNTQYLDGKS